MTRTDPPSASEAYRARRVGEVLAPFVAWLATRDLDEDARRRYRDAAERFLGWSLDDTGPLFSRRRRYEHHVRHQHPDHLRDARAGLDRWMEHRHVVARTLPIDG